MHSSKTLNRNKKKKINLVLSPSSTVNKHKPWIEASYHGVITENMETVLLDPPLVALDKDVAIPYAGSYTHGQMNAKMLKSFQTTLEPLRLNTQIFGVLGFNLFY